MTPSPTVGENPSKTNKPYKSQPHLQFTQKDHPIDSQAIASRAARINKACRADQLQRMIAEAAYYKAEKRGFSPDGQVSDWLEAEKEIMAIVFQ